MNNKDMQYVLMIAKYGNMTKAAEALYVSQPALSIQLNRLEEELGLKLFERKSKGMVLTYAGEEFVRRAQEISMMRYELVDYLNNIREQSATRIRVGYTVKHMPLLFPDVFIEFSERHPNVQVVSVEGHVSDLEDQLSTSELDIVFAYCTVKRARFHYTELYQDHLLAVLRKDHPACQKAVPPENSIYAWLDLKEVEDERFILQQSEQSIRQFEEDALTYAGVHPKLSYKISSIEAGTRLAAAGYGIAFTYQNHSSLPENAACFLVGDPDISIPLYACVLKEKKNDPLLTDWIEITRRRIGG